MALTFAIMRSSMTRPRLILAAALLWAVAFAAAQAAPLKLPPPARFGVFLLGQRAGQAKLTAVEEKFEGKRAVRVDADTSLKVQALGEVEQQILTRQYVTPDGQPL